MALGRIERQGLKISKLAWRFHEPDYERDNPPGLLFRPKRLNIPVVVRREIGSRGSYRAMACVGASAALDRFRRDPLDIGRQNKSCAFAWGRTPQSAVAKAVKRVSGKIASRGRR